MPSAVELDAAGDVIAAIEAYELLLSEGIITRDEVLNLAFLYGNCWDFGFSANHALDMEFVRTIAERFTRAVAAARERFGDWPDTCPGPFWGWTMRLRLNRSFGLCLRAEPR